MSNLLDTPIVKYAIGLGVVVVVAGLSIFGSIESNLISGAQEGAGLLSLVAIAWAWTGFRK